MAEPDLVVRGGTVATATGLFAADIAVRGERIRDRDHERVAHPRTRAMRDPNLMIPQQSFSLLAIAFAYTAIGPHDRGLVLVLMFCATRGPSHSRTRGIWPIQPYSLLRVVLGTTCATRFGSSSSA